MLEHFHRRSQSVAVTLDIWTVGDEGAESELLLQ